METAQQVKENFLRDFDALLNKYGPPNWGGAGIELEGDGFRAKMVVGIQGLYDKDGNTTREYTEINLGTAYYPSEE
jgi:hypothetical protein